MRPELVSRRAARGARAGRERRRHAGSAAFRLRPRLRESVFSQALVGTRASVPLGWAAGSAHNSRSWWRWRWRSRSSGRAAARSGPRWSPHVLRGSACQPRRDSRFRFQTARWTGPAVFRPQNGNGLPAVGRRGCAALTLHPAEKKPMPNRTTWTAVGARRNPWPHGTPHPSARQGPRLAPSRGVPRNAPSTRTDCADGAPHAPEIPEQLPLRAALAKVCKKNDSKKHNTTATDSNNNHHHHHNNHNNINGKAPAAGKKAPAVQNPRAFQSGPLQQE